MTIDGGTIEIEFEAEALLRATGELMPLLEEYVSDALYRGVWVVANHAKAKENHDYQDRTTFLTGSIGRSDPSGSLASNDLQVDFIAGGLQIDYAKYIEFGTRHIRPRRFMRNAVDAQAATVVDMIQGAIERAVDEAGL